MNKKILIITPFCAPESHAAVFRAHKLAKYLKKEGWEPQILTVDTNYIYNEDQALLDELKGIPIHRAKYIEPSLRGLYMWLTRKDRTFKTLKRQEKKTVYTNLKTEDKKNVKSGVFNAFYKFLLDHYLRKPDRFWTWKRSAIKKATHLIVEHNIEFVYTTSGPYTTGVIGCVLKTKLNIKWIADFRDPQLSVSRNHSKIKNVQDVQRKIHFDTLHKADQIITASYAHKLMLESQFDFVSDKTSFIPTGLDDEYIPYDISLESREEDYIIFVGEYLKEYGDYFFKLYSISKASLKIKIVGNINVNKSIINDYITKYSLVNNIEFIDHLTQKNLYRLILKAKAALLIPNSLWWCSFAKMVDYIALKVPVITLVPEISEARTQLQNSGLGIFLTGDIEKDIILIKTLFDEKSEIIRPNIDFCNKYLATSQVNSFIKIFNDI